MPPARGTLEASIEAARDVVLQEFFVRDRALEILDNIPTAGLSTQVLGAITYAKFLALTAPKFTKDAASARFALARVVELLEKQ